MMRARFLLRVIKVKNHDVMMMSSRKHFYTKKRERGCVEKEYYE